MLVAGSAREAEPREQCVPRQSLGTRVCEKLGPKVSGTSNRGNERPLGVANGSCKPNTFGFFPL